MYVHECSIAPICSANDSIDGNLCPVAESNTTCLVFYTFEDPVSNLQCYQSLCAPLGSEFYEVDRHRIEIEGIVYRQKQPRTVELWEVKIYRRADDCSRTEIFNELTSQLDAEYGDLSTFDRVTSTTTESTSTQSTTAHSQQQFQMHQSLPA